MALIKELKVGGRAVGYIRCDNAGENVKTEELMRSEGLGVEFEYTAAGTPQQNGKIERKIATRFR